MKKLMITMLVVILVMSMVGCQNSTEPIVEPTGNEDATNQEEVTIQFMHMQIEQERLDEIQNVIDKFEAANPGIFVEQVPVNEDDYDTKIVTLGGSGQLPAVIEYSQNQARMRVTNQFTDTSAINEVIEAKGIDAFYSGALEAMKNEDGVSYAAVPVSNWVQGLWVNEAMLKEKGFSIPTNWDDVLEIAQAFYNPDEKQYGIAIPTGET